MNESVETAIADQIREELYSAYFYLSAASYFESISLTGFAGWMRQQSQEEIAHAMKFFDFVHDRGSRVVLQAIPQPPYEFSSPLDAFSQALAHERKVTARINEFYALTVREQDYPAQVLLQWFISEQVEEEKTTGQLVEELRMVGDNSSALLLLNNNAAARRSTSATPTA
jgi:ferritin